MECRALYDESLVGRPGGPYRSKQRAQRRVDHRNAICREIYGNGGSIYYRLGDRWESE